MLSSTQIIAFLFFLSSFGVSPALISQIHVILTTPQAQATTTQAVGNATTTGDSSISDVQPSAVGSTSDSTVDSISSQTQGVAQAPLLVPVCEVGATFFPTAFARTSPAWGYLTWQIDPRATAYIQESGDQIGNAAGKTETINLPIPVNASESYEFTQSVATSTYILTEIMTDPAYQATTTCSADATI